MVNARKEEETCLSEEAKREEQAREKQTTISAR